MASPSGAGGLVRRFTQTVINRITGTVPANGVATSVAASAAVDGTRGQEEFEGAYFPPGRPLRPVAPAGSTTGRAWDYPSFINLTYAPRGEPGENAIGFRTLQRLCDPAEGGLDVLRLAIETRKDQFAAQKWAIRGRQKGDDGGPKARQAEQWLRAPDAINTFGVWMRMLLEDHYVLDAPTLYCSQGDGRPLFEIVDGATIKLLIDGGGRRPQLPLPAFQQFIKGTPAEDYTTQQIGYYPYNLRPSKLYGMSRVEQVLTTINIALNRQLSQLSFYTEGTLPDSLISLPATWSMEQIRDYQEWFDGLLEGQVGKRRKAFFVPDGSKTLFTKEAALKDEFDEWIVRVVCYCFSLPPTAFVRQMNRATAENAKQQAQEEGLEPDKLWFKDVMDDLLARMGQPELEWYWEDEEITDPQIKATVAVSLYGGAAGTAKPIMTLAEVREMMNLAPATPEQLKELQPPEPEPQPSGPTDGALNADDDGRMLPSRVGKAAGSNGRGRALRPLAPNTRLRDATEHTLHAHALTQLTVQRTALTHALGAAHRTAKTAGDYLEAPVDDTTLADLMQALEAAPWDTAAREALRAALAELARERTDAAFTQVHPFMTQTETDAIAMLSQANRDAVDWAQGRTDNLITQVSESTQQAVNEMVAAAIRDGQTNGDLADTLSDVFGFSSERAMLIARTETAAAETAGALIGYQASGVVSEKQWLADPDACDDCADLDGEVVPIDETFSDGEDGPPDHPNCRCVVVPVVAPSAAPAA